MCSGANEDEGCQSDNHIFQPGMAESTWINQDCDYKLCTPCVKHYAKNPESIREEGQRYNMFDQGEEDMD